MITDSNHACMAKMIGRRVQEGVLFFPGKIWPPAQFYGLAYNSLVTAIIRNRRFRIESKDNGSLTWFLGGKFTLECIEIYGRIRGESMRTPLEIGLQLWGCTDNPQNLKPITAVAMMPSILNLSSIYSNFACSVQRYLPSTPRNIFGAML